jgi:hypothetical protein
MDDGRPRGETGTQIRPNSTLPSRANTPAIEKLQGQVSLVNVPAMELGIQLQDLFKLVQERKDQRPPNSYTSYLFNSGLDKNTQEDR